jgi:hypothetical protein
MNEAIFRKCGSFSIHRIQETHVELLHIVWDMVQAVLGEEDVI